MDSYIYVDIGVHALPKKVNDANVNWEYLIGKKIVGLKNNQPYFKKF